jgi:diacylglycerol kinase family enzyme
MNEVVNGLAHSSVPIGILPGGTGNGLAREAGIGINMISAANQLSQWVPRRISLGLCTTQTSTRYFLLLCGVGFDALVIYRLRTSAKGFLGKKFSYWLEGFSLVSHRLPEFTIDVGGSLNRATLAVASRVRNYGGDFVLAQSVTLLDDDFEVVLLTGRTAISYLRYLAAVVGRRIQHARGVTFLRARAIRLSPLAHDASTVYVQLDGDHMATLPVSLEIVTDCVTLLLPPHYGLSPEYHSQRMVAL